MIGLPSGLERVRWNEFGEFAAAGQHAQDLGAARGRGFIALQHQRAGALGHDEAVAVLGEWPGGRMRGIVAGRQRRQQRKPDQRFRIDRTVGRDAERGIGLAAANGLDAELDRAGAGRACGRQRDRRTLGAELVGQIVRHRAEQKAPVVAGVFAAAADAQQIVVIEFGLVGVGSELQPLRPFDLDRRHRQKQRSREIARSTDRGLRDSLLGDEIGKPLRKIGRAGRLERQEIDRAGH